MYRLKALTRRRNLGVALLLLLLMMTDDITTFVVVVASELLAACHGGAIPPQNVIITLLFWLRQEPCLPAFTAADAAIGHGSRAYSVPVLHGQSCCSQFFLS